MPRGRTGLYPGTFDPVTNGHLDIIARAATITDRLIVAVAVNDGKAPMFPLADRLDMVQSEIASLAPSLAERIDVTEFGGLLMKFVDDVGASVVIRGLRAVSDFEYEFQMAGMNARLNPDVETVFLMASDRHQFISSRFVKEIGRLGGDIGHFVSPAVKSRLIEKYAELDAAAE